MKLSGKKIGYAITGSFCTVEAAFDIIFSLKNEGAEVTAIVSDSINSFSTRFMERSQLRQAIISLPTGAIIDSIIKAEPVGPQRLFDLVIVAPCTGNTLAKLAHGITDTSVTMAVKSHLRNNRPVLLGISTNDGLGVSAKNLGVLLNMKNYYFTPFYQDNPEQKPKSLVFRHDKLVESAELALMGQQIQPIIGG